MSETLIVNFLAGPGAGKSTMAAHLYSALKWMGINCELVTEYAKDVVWEESFKILDDQIFVFGKQLHRLNILRGKVDVVITDAPLFNSILYYKGAHESTFVPLVLDVIKSMNNVNFFINRVKPYNPKGRIQTEDEARDLDIQVKNLLNKHGIEYAEVTGVPFVVPPLIAAVLDMLEKDKPGPKLVTGAQAFDIFDKIQSPQLPPTNLILP